ncbi:MAG: hypothetical protein ACK4GW_07050 [Pseudorhodobacter sp.]
MTDHIAILTGDLVGSTDAPAGRVSDTMILLAAIAREIGPDCRFTRHRGDGWQMALTEPGDCLWACLYILARLRADPDALPSRIAAGIGAYHPTDATDLSTAMGPAFTASGRALDQMARGQYLALSGKKTEIDRFRKLAFAFAEEHAIRWSKEQAEAMAHALHPDAPTQEQIAQALGISRQAVGLRLKAAGYHVLDQACLAFRAEPILPFPQETTPDPAP